MSPFVLVRIGELQALLHLFKADAASALVRYVLGEVAIDDFARDFPIVMTHYGDADEAFFRWADAMLKGVLDKRDEDQRGDFQCTGTRIEIYANIYTLGQTDTHERDIVADEIEFLLQGHERLLIVVQHMAQELTQFQYRILCLFSIEGYQGIDIVQCVEQEMWIKLILEILELGIRLLLFDFDEPFFGLPSTDTDAYGRTKTYDEGHHHQITPHKHPSAKHHGRRWHVRSAHHSRWSEEK